MAPVVMVTRVAVEWRGSTPSNTWLQKRLELAEQYTIPSVLTALGRGVPIKWVWQATPRHAETLVDFACRMGIGDVVHVQDRDAVTVPGLPESGLVNVLRIDSDDAPHPNALQTLAEVPLDDGHLLEFMHGYQLKLPEMTVGEFHRAWLAKRSVSPVFAIGRPAESALDVIGYHAQGRRPVRRLRMTDVGSFMQIVGHGNVHNRWWPVTRTLDRVQAVEILAEFGILGGD